MYDKKYDAVVVIATNKPASYKLSLPLNGM